MSVFPAGAEEGTEQGCCSVPCTSSLGRVAWGGRKGEHSLEVEPSCSISSSGCHQDQPCRLCPSLTAAHPFPSLGKNATPGGKHSWAQQCAPAQRWGGEQAQEWSSGGKPSLSWAWAGLSWAWAEPELCLSCAWAEPEPSLSWDRAMPDLNLRWFWAEPELGLSWALAEPELSLSWVLAKPELSPS